MSAGYVLLAGIFVAMVGVCFAFAVAELVRPRDPGPLPIDVRRDIQHRYFASLLRKRPGPAQNILAGDPTHERRFNPREMPDGACVGSGNESYLVHGSGSVLPGAHVDSFVCESVATIGAAALVREHAEGEAELFVDTAAVVGGRATSAHRVVLAASSRVHFAAAPIIRTTGGPSPRKALPLAPWDEQRDADLEWLLVNGTPMDRAVRDLAAGSGQHNAIEGLLRAEASVLSGDQAIPLTDKTCAPSWIGRSEAWYLGAATLRVRGDLILPPGAIVPCHLIVEGSLATGEDVLAHGSIHAWGDVVLGAGSRVEGSITGRRAIRLGAHSAVGGVVSGNGDVVVGAGCVIGSERSGGVTSGGAVTLGPGIQIAGKLYAEDGAQVAAIRSEFAPA